MNPYALYAKHFAPDFGDAVFHKIFRGYVIILQLEPSQLRCGQGLSVQLAVRCERQRFQEQERGRHHVLGELLLQKGA